MLSSRSLALCLSLSLTLFLSVFPCLSVYVGGGREEVIVLKKAFLQMGLLRNESSLEKRRPKESSFDLEVMESVFNF